MPKTKLDWQNLADDDFPKCGNSLNASDPGVTCSNSLCDFFITHERMEELKDKFGRDKRAHGNEFEGYGDNFGMD